MNGKITVISRILDKGILAGFLVIDELGQGFTSILSLDMVRNLGFSVEYSNARYSEEYRTLTGVGLDLVSLPSISPEFVITDNNGVVAVATIVDSETKQDLGVICFNGIGLKYQVSYKKLNELCSRYKPLNFKISGNNVTFLDGKPLPRVEMYMPKKEQRVYNSANNEVKPIIYAKSSTEQHQLGTIDLDAVKVSEFTKPAQEKLFLALVNMQKLTPYYHCCLQAIKKQAVINFGTMGVTEDTLTYDLAFIAGLSIAELTFVLIHEVCHIAQQHAIRGRGKHHDLFNIACDLYINALICYDFKIRYGDTEKTFDNGSVLKTPVNGSFLEVIDEVLDLALDTPETIYKRLCAENPNGAQSSQGQGNQGQGQGNQGQGSQGQGQQGQSNQSQQGQVSQSQGQGNQGQGSQGQGQQGQSNQSQGQQGQGSQGSNRGTSINQAMRDISVGSKEARSDVNNKTTQSAQSQISSGLNDLKNGMNSGNQQQINEGISKIQSGIDSMKTQTNAGVDKMQSGLDTINDLSSKPQQEQQQPNNQNNTEGDLSQNNGNDSNQSLRKTVTVLYNGKKLTCTVDMDILTNNNRQDKDSQDSNVSKSKDALQKIRTKLDIKEEELGESLLKNAGDGASLTDRYIDFGLSSSIDWRVLLKNALKIEHKKLFTLASPNTDYMSMGMTLADRRKYGKPSKASGVKICIDVSGSVSKKELDSYLSEVASMFRYYNVEGELIYWSTKVGNAGDVESLKDLLEVAPSSTGGTDVSCVFEYLNREKMVNGQYQKTKPKDISVIFIITDGCFSHNYANYERYGSKVVWLINGNCITFKPLFGKVVSFDIKNER